MELPALAKNPMVIAVGVAIGALLLFGAKNTASGNAASNLASQQIATNADISYSQDQTAQYEASLQANVALASVNAAFATTGLNARTAIAVDAMNNANAIVLAGMQSNLIQSEMATSVVRDKATNETLLALARDSNATQLAMIPFQVDAAKAIASISSDTAKTVATINANASNTNAQIQAASVAHSSDNNLFGSVVSSIPSLVAAFA